MTSAITVPAYAGLPVTHRGLSSALHVITVHISAIGPATAEALRLHGLQVDFMPEVYDGAHLTAGLAESGGEMLLLRAEMGSPDLTEVLRE